MNIHFGSHLLEGSLKHHAEKCWGILYAKQSMKCFRLQFIGGLHTAYWSIAKTMGTSGTWSQASTLGGESKDIRSALIHHGAKISLQPWGIVDKCGARLQKATRGLHRRSYSPSFRIFAPIRNLDRLHNFHWIVLCEWLWDLRLYWHSARDFYCSLFNLNEKREKSLARLQDP